MSKIISTYVIKISDDIPFIEINCELPISENGEFSLSNWRPGRYEFGNFAKNIKGLKVFDASGRVLKCQKISRNTWRISDFSSQIVKIKYQYFANELNAGSTFTDGSFLYVNPVNCLLYSTSSFSNQCNVKVLVPDEWQIVGTPNQQFDFTLENFDRLADTPFITDLTLNSVEFTTQDICFKVTFHGLEGDIHDKLIQDFKKFTSKQLSDFTYFPSKYYDFIVICPDYKAYHGVEHSSSTIITLGPKNEIFNELYTELLGVSSHELYHVWNVKSFRPKEMTPYNFNTENYSRFGYIYEGVTTYLGDLYLLKSKVFSFEQYSNELEQQINKHASNNGRFNYSLGDSSVDSWIDGYVQGIPGRKVSIYTEGCLFAFLLDIEIIQLTNGEKSIIDFMNLLSFFKEGYDLDDILKILCDLCSKNFHYFFEQYIDNPTDFVPILEQKIDLIGLSLELSESSLALTEKSDYARKTYKISKCASLTQKQLMFFNKWCE